MTSQIRRFRSTWFYLLLVCSHQCGCLVRCFAHDNAIVQTRRTIHDHNEYITRFRHHFTSYRISSGRPLPHRATAANGGLADSHDDSSSDQQLRGDGSSRINSSAPSPFNMWPNGDILDQRLIKVALPVIANFAINPLIGAVDLFWVNRMQNALAVAGQAAANQVFNSAFWIVSFLPSVTATLISKQNAAGNPEGIQDAICQALFVGIIMATIATFMLLKMPDHVLRLVLAPGAPALAFARPYLMIRALAFVPSLISLVGFSAFRGILDTLTPVQISSFANVFNAVLDPILIFTCAMGVPGAALATLAAEVISAGTYLVLLRRRQLIRFGKIFRVPAWQAIQPLLQGGAALQLRNVALNWTFLAVARVTQSIDETGVAAAAHAMALQVFQVGGIVLLALSTVAQTVIPNDLVLRRNLRGEIVGGKHVAAQTMQRLMSWGLVLGIALGSMQIVLLPLIQRATPLPEVREAAKVPAYLASVFQIMNGLVFIGEGIMIGCGNFMTLSLSTVVATVGCLWALRVFPPTLGLTGVWIGFGVFNSLRLLGVYLHQRRIGPLARRKMKEEIIVG